MGLHRSIDWKTGVKRKSAVQPYRPKKAIPGGKTDKHVVETTGLAEQKSILCGSLLAMNSGSGYFIALHASLLKLKLPSSTHIILQWPTNSRSLKQ